MITKVMIDAGIRGRINCEGKFVPIGEEDLSPAYRIGEVLSERLERTGYETLFSGNVAELNERAESAGWPSLCAAVAKRWGAECIVRLCVKSSELPNESGAEAMVNRRNSGSWSLGVAVLESLERGSGMRSKGVRSAEGMMLLRRSVCPCMILVL